MKVLPFTGWEPHRTVAWIRRCREANGVPPACIVFGREPITSSEIWLEGVVVEERHDKYDRGFTLADAEGLKYKVGGTNTTSSIALHFLLLYVPDEVLASPASQLEVQELSQ